MGCSASRSCKRLKESTWCDPTKFCPHFAVIQRFYMTSFINCPSMWWRILCIVQNIMYGEEYYIWWRILCMVKNTMYGEEYYVWWRILCMVKNIMYGEEYHVWWRIVCVVVFTVRFFHPAVNFSYARKYSLTPKSLTVLTSSKVKHQVSLK